jgi:hypothetical protein
MLFTADGNFLDVVKNFFLHRSHLVIMDFSVGDNFTVLHINLLLFDVLFEMVGHSPLLLDFFSRKVKLASRGNDQMLRIMLRRKKPFFIKLKLRV